MTARDRTVVTVLAALALVAAAWFLLLSPVRKESAALDAKVAAAQARLTAAQALVASGEAAKVAYKADYAAVSRLGKAVPADDDVPSLVVQLEGAADRSKVDFRSIELAAGGASAPLAATQAAAVASATGATGATGAAGAPPPVVPATQAVSSTLPPGASVGAAGFPTMPFDFAFTGSFFKLQDFLGRLDRFTEVDGQDITVRGRLLTVDGFSLTPGPKGFPDMLASVRATAYLLPPGQAAGAAVTAAGTTTAAIPAVGSAAAPATSPGTTP